MGTEVPEFANSPKGVLEIPIHLRSGLNENDLYGIGKTATRTTTEGLALSPSGK